MKMMFVLLLMIVPLLCPAKEQERTWTAADGRTMEGTLKDKTQTHATIESRGQLFEIEIASLSQADQDYIRKADVFPDTTMDVQVVKVNNPALSSSYEYRKLNVSLAHTHGRVKLVRVIWLSSYQGRTRIHEKEEFKVSKDGVLVSKTKYSRYGPRYKGYVVGVMGELGWMLREANQKPFERYLDASEQESESDY